MNYYLIIRKDGIYSLLTMPTSLCKEECENYYSSDYIYDIVDITNPALPQSMIVKFKLHDK